MTATDSRNTYLDQVLSQQQVLQEELRSKRTAPPPAPAAAAPPAQAPAQAAVFRGAAPGGGPGRRSRGGAAGTAAPERATPGAVDVRISGFWRWRTVLVPPNAFVVHTRRGRAEPLHVGLGVSFRFNPATDSFLVVPGAMQTIVISAYCICRELQGVVVQAYVQWIIQDFATAYKKLDFGDAEDPMRLVNLQLREQAEAAIKDKVATLGVHEVLSDKQPIIEELTARLRAVAEGEGDSDQGLGLRIVTVQIKEAVVSSARLWENLQKPYRSEQARVARLAELAAQEAISEREMTAERTRETQRIEHERELSELRARNEALSFDREAAEKVRRAERDQEDTRTLADLDNETAMHALNLERARNAEETELARLRVEQQNLLARLELDAELAVAAARAQGTHDAALLDIERDRLRAAIDNEQSPISVQARLVDSLPEIMGRLPKPAELRAVSINGANATTVSGLIAELAAVVGALQSALPRRTD